MGQWPVDEVAEDGLDDRVGPVRDISVHGRECGVGEERVVAPHREQLVLLAAPVADPADDQPRGVLVCGAGERGVAGALFTSLPGNGM